MAQSVPFLGISSRSHRILSLTFVRILWEASHISHPRREFFHSLGEILNTWQPFLSYLSYSWYIFPQWLTTVIPWNVNSMVLALAQVKGNEENLFIANILQNTFYVSHICNAYLFIQNKLHLYYYIILLVWDLEN